MHGEDIKHIKIILILHTLDVRETKNSYIFYKPSEMKYLSHSNNNF